MPSKLEPGERFTIEFWPGRTISACALSARQRGKIGEIIEQIRDKATGANDPDGRRWSIIREINGLRETAVRICYPEADDAFFDSLNEDMLDKIVSLTMTEAKLSEDESKKLESQH